MTSGRPGRVAVDIVTGFLGAGKTTLLRALLEAAPSRERIAVIVNEVGEIGIDGRVLTGFDFLENVVELADGCICCSIDEYRFDFAVDELLRRLDPTLLLIETSGVADPAPTIERVQRCGLGLDAVLAVVDAQAWTRAWRLSTAARRQIQAADFLVLSKLDLVSPRAAASMRRRLGRLAPRAALVAADHGRVAADVLLATSLRRHRSAAAVGGEAEERRPLAHLDEDGVESFVARLPRPVDRAGFEAFLAALPAAVWRAKGFVHFAAESSAHLFNFTCGRFEIAPLPLAPQSTARAPAPAGDPAVEAVFIGRDLLRLRPGIEGALAACGQVERTPRKVQGSAAARAGGTGERGLSDAPDRAT